LLHFFKYEKSESAVEDAMRQYGLDLQLTGALGKRTIYQQQDVAQLTLNIEQKAVDLNLQNNDAIYTDSIYRIDKEM
jgi:hypothetical protein